MLFFQRAAALLLLTFICSVSTATLPSSHARKGIRQDLDLRTSAPLPRVPSAQARSVKPGQALALRALNPSPEVHLRILDYQAIINSTEASLALSKLYTHALDLVETFSTSNSFPASMTRWVFNFGAMQLGFVGLPQNWEDARFIMIQVLMSFVIGRFPLGLMKVALFMKEANSQFGMFCYVLNTRGTPIHG